jgi:hypothetical protein
VNHGLEERERTSDDVVLSAPTAAELMGVTRQAVDKAVREGRYPGFRDPVTLRIWADRRWVEANAPGGAHLLARVEVLENQIQAMQDAGRSQQVEGRQANPHAEPERAAIELLEENTTLKTVNLELLAAAKEQANAERLLEEATKDEEAGRRKRRRAAAAQRRAREHYIEALTHTQLPGSARDLGPLDP